MQNALKAVRVLIVIFVKVCPTGYRKGSGAEPPCLPACISHKHPILINQFLAYQKKKKRERMGSGVVLLNLFLFLEPLAVSDQHIWVRKPAPLRQDFSTPGLFTVWAG